MQPIVETTYGRVQGDSEQGIHVFKGIPYAQPPVGELRFRPPQPPQPWKDVLQATTFGHSAIQAVGAFSPEGMTTSEDCLSLNIWTPALDGQRRPVLVWIHGGAFIAGGSVDHLYDGISFAQRGDIVVVTINYRLGALGFLHLGDLLGAEYASSSNSGLLDIVAALRWVHENIAAFGGDPEHVTVMGESAGGKLVGTLLAVPEAQGLFQQAIEESGSGQSARDPQTATSITRRLLATLNLPESEARQLLTLPAETILRAQVQMLGGFHSLHFFGPVVDGTVLPQLPFAAIRDGNVPALPTLIGSTRQEAMLYMKLDPKFRQPNAELITFLFGQNAAAVWQAFERLSQQLSARDAWVQVLTDALYGHAARYQADIQAQRGVPVWLYRFDWSQGDAGAMHGQELPFVFNNLGLSSMASIGPAAGSAADQPFADVMQQTWISFIRNGDPNHAQLPTWPAYNQHERSIMTFNTTSQLIQEPASILGSDFNIDQVYTLSS